MIYYTGDIHGNPKRVLTYIDYMDVRKRDTIVILGDAGLNYLGNDSGDRFPKQMLNRAGIEILCIHGNHEMRPGSLPYYHTKEWHGGRVYVEDEFPNLLFAIDGDIYDLDGKKAIVLGGAYSVDKYYRLQQGARWFQDEQPSEAIKEYAQQQLERHGWKMDVVLSHTCPTKYIPHEAFLPGIDQAYVDRSTEDWLDGIEDRLDYGFWLCGHWHIDKRIDNFYFLMRSFKTL